MAQTKSQLVTYVTDKFGVTTTAMVTRAKGFYDVRYRMIQDRFLWKEMIVSESQNVSAGTQDVTMTSAVDFVVAARWNDLMIYPLNQEQVFQIDGSAFDNEGDVVSFSVLPKTDAGLARIRLYRIPSAQRELTIIGKSPLETLEDAESPKLSGIDQALQAYVLGDLWEHQRQFSKRDALFSEAEAFLTKMMDLERQQASSNNQIIPIPDGQYNRDYLYI